MGVVLLKRRYANKQVQNPFDFANLALGAFLGSYVQKKEKELEQLNPKEDKPPTEETKP